MANWEWSDAHNDYYLATRDQYGNVEYQWAKSTRQKPRADSGTSPPAAEASSPTTQQHLYQQQEPTCLQPYQQPTSQKLTYQTTYQQPTSQQSAFQPPYQQPTYPQPAYQQPTYPQPAYQQSTYQQPNYQQDASEQPASLQQSQEEASPQEGSSPESAATPAAIASTIAGAEGARPGDPEPLDDRYIVRTDARRFFIRGRVFSVLFSEPLAETSKKIPEFGEDFTQKGGGLITQVKYGQYVFTQVRRFVVVDEKRGWCYACPVSTYSQRGTLKPGCRAAEHAVIYNIGLQEPQCLPGERGITKNPIGVVSTETEPMHVASRIRFGMVHPIQWNVKVKDLGKVSQQDMPYLISYYREEHE